MEEILDNRSHPEIDLIVVTDGEGILGIGDQGIGGMDIPIAKLMLYTLCAGINPLRTLPIMLDVGTNNEKLLNDPLYLGLRQPRIQGKDYDDFIEHFIATVKRKFPHVFLHWEDFGRNNAKRNLDRYRDKICSFNDDIQGTGAVALAALLAAVQATGSKLQDQRIVVFGAGSAGMGVVEQISAAMKHEGLSEREVRQRFWLIDQPGLLLNNMPALTPAQQPFARDPNELVTWPAKNNKLIDLLTVIQQVQPTVLIGCSGRGGAFTQNVIVEMARHCSRPIIFPLSNPTDYAEATPADLLHWTDGKALIATGSPFLDVNYQDKNIAIAQSNNALVFPGIGLGILAAKACQLSDGMLWAACCALRDSAPILHNVHAPLLPSLAEASQVAYTIALAVAKQAQCEGLSALLAEEKIEMRIKDLQWYPHYVPLRKR
jgi:malate dehydrogenase (oxaloacetate-decarboxylating)